VATFFRRSYQFPHTKYLTTACTTLKSAREYESDRFLVAQIRIQRLVTKAYNALPNPDFDTSVQADFHAAQYMTMLSIRNEIESLKKDLPPEIQNHCKLLYAIGTRFYIHPAGTKKYL
jgi:hypothetical protein